VNSPRVKVLYDLYHSVTEGEDTAAILPQIAASLGHVRWPIAPGRGEPVPVQID
jgi:hydroxypyruvate isomerase